MDAQLPSRWRWAWFCPRCGVHNPAAAAACEGCGLDHALLGAPGPIVRHTCGVAAPAWAAYCIGCGEPLNAPAAEEAAADSEDGDSPGGPRGSRAGGEQANDPADDLADRDAVFVHDVSEPVAPRDLDAPPLPPPRQRRILPANDGPTEGLTLSRHLLLERAVEPRPHWSERFRLLLLVLILALSTGLFVRALAAPDDSAIAFMRAHAVPIRGSAEALALLEGLHKLLAGPGASAQVSTWTARVERVEAAPNGAQGRWVVVRVALRNGASAPASLAPGDVHLVDAAGRDVAASDASAAVARAAGLSPLGEAVQPGQESSTIVVFAVPSDPPLREPKLRIGGADTPLNVPP